MADYRTKQPGDVLLLSHDLDRADAGLYVLIDPHADVVTLCRLGEDADSGNLVTTRQVVSVSIADLSHFEPTGLSLDLVSDPSSCTVSDISIGDVLEPLSGASVPIGLYQVIRIEGEDILLSRCHSNEDDKLATTGRVSWIGRSELGLFRRLRIGNDLRP